MEQKTLKLLIIKNITYTLFILLSYIVQETPGIFSHIHPVIVLSAVISIAMNEGEFSGGLYGLLGGLLCDTAAFHMFGVASIFFSILGCTGGLLVIYLVHPNVKSAALMSAAAAFIYSSVSYYIIYGMWGYEGSEIFYIVKSASSSVSTAVFGALIFILIRKIKLLFEKMAKED